MKHLAILAILLCLFSKNDAFKPTPEKPTHAGEAMRMHAMARLFPDGQMHTEQYMAGMAQKKWETQFSTNNNIWEALGPKNIGGRTLCLAVNPLDTNIIFIGSASGGLWKSTTAGKGTHAWVPVITGYPLLGVSSIVMDPSNPQIMFIGTGEVYNFENSAPGVANRTTRGTYGIGILKTTDGGLTWQKSLDWSYGSLRGVQDIKMNSQQPNTLFAATTEGIYRTYNAGQTWQQISNQKMAVDLAIDPVDTNRIFATHGSLDDMNWSGVYRSLDGGNTFSLLNNGLPTGYSGKAMIDISPSNHLVAYASVCDAFSQIGLFRTDNGGDSWSLVNSENVAAHQGWYSHDVAMKPDDPDYIVHGGFDIWISTDGGNTPEHKTFWYNWFFGVVPVGGPEGPPDYVHADIHRVYFLPSDPNKVYAVTDGGVFVSHDAGNTWAGRNGGYQSTQFYANIGNSASNPALCIGGMQDNATAIYQGQDAWMRVLGGDGLSAAISPNNDQLIYGSSQYLNISKSVNGGFNWQNISPYTANNEEANFAGPFELAPSNPNLIYAGAESMHVSQNGGSAWVNISNGPVDDGNTILTISVNANDPQKLYFSTAPLVTDQAHVFKSVDGGITNQIMTGLPNRMCMDVAQHPFSPTTAYAVFAGFNTNHVYKTTDDGANWLPIDNGLPDVPVNTILIDPDIPEHVYIGNDLGVWASANGGETWSLFSDEIPDAMMVMDLSISAANHKLRVGTHGLGVWQTDLMSQDVAVHQPKSARFLHLSPNPCDTRAQVDCYFKTDSRYTIFAADLSGKVLETVAAGSAPAGPFTCEILTKNLKNGAYVLILEGKSTGGRVFRDSWVLRVVH